MSNNTTIRSGKDRLRYTLIFEGLLILVTVPAGALFYDKPLASIGLLGVILAVKAMVINLIYNWVFDRFDARRGRMSTERSHLGRLAHAFGFEATLLSTSLPLYTWWLGIGVFEALAVDLVVTSFVVVYTYGFTLMYDRVFPLSKPDARICT